MDITQAAKILAENNAQCTYDVFVPSLNSTVPFKSMTVGQFKSMAKAAITSDTVFNDYLANLIVTLSDNVIDLKKINVVDKIYILSGIKYKGTPPSNGIGVRCTECDRIHNDIEVFESFDHANAKNITDTISYEINGLSVDMEIGLPSVKDVLDYESYVSNKYINTDLDESAIRTAVVMGEFESKLMCVKAVTINGENIDGYADLELSQKFTVLSTVSNDYFDVEKVNAMIDANIAYIKRDVECEGCGFIIPYIIEPSDFFL
jgi:hypothetical protein